MRIYKENDTSRAICHHCKKLVNTTLKTRDVPFSDGSGVAKAILAGVCDICDKVVSTPQQSAPRIKEAMNKDKKSIEARLPRHLLDILVVAGDKLKAQQPNSFTGLLLKYYIHSLNADNRKSKALQKYLKIDLAKGKAGTERLSLKVNSNIFAEFESLRSKTKLTKTELLKALTLKIYDDVLKNKSTDDIKALKNIAAISG
jgi:hypothetical protein